MTERCPTCGHAVIVAPDSDGYAAWCACSMVSRADPAWRGTGHGKTAEEALEQWRLPCRSTGAGDVCANCVALERKCRGAT